ncbi:amyloid-beta A4 precursor protein-binding family B member 3-like [Rhincodon typus]|uniref:amyloid-beta A4 precursor protein-binding family B member 3-like n=1 Tax=Rhincodon typus TaxID=259920 RepID=UPI00202FD68A|nr:amyloid-beta A4 precursor protein-binding family B member 3-like [Rhincodon typus]
MLGKDYMLAIIIVNYDDNLWNDQSLEIDPDLPPGWRMIRDTCGTYYWHIPTGTTQWQHPVSTSDISLDSRKLSPGLSPTLEHKAVIPGAAGVHRLPRGGRFQSSMPASSSINLRDFAYVASDKDTCMLKCHVFHCNTPAKAIATALHQMCSQIMAERANNSGSSKVSRVEDSISPVDLPLQVDLLETVRQSVQRFNVQYIGSLPVTNSMGMKLVNGVIKSLLDSVDRCDWPSVLLQVTDTTLSVSKGEESRELCWQCQVRYLTFLGIGKDPHTFGLIVDTGLQHFECHVFWCEPDAGYISEAIQAACMLQYQKCLVATAPTVRSKRATHSQAPSSGLKKHLSSPMIDGAGATPGPLLSAPKFTSGSNLKRGILALLDTFKHKHSVLQMP